MDRVALDGTRPDDGHLDDEVVELVRLRLWQRLHLGPRFDLEHTHGIGGHDHVVDLRQVLRQCVKVQPDAAVGQHQPDRFIDRGQHPESQQVQLDQAQ